MAEAVQEQQTNDTTSELERPLWSVISFERREGAGLTYPQAVDLLKELDSQKVSGLAIVTDKAAGKLRS